MEFFFFHLFVVMLPSVTMVRSEFFFFSFLLLFLFAGPRNVVKLFTENNCFNCLKCPTVYLCESLFE